MLASYKSCMDISEVVMENQCFDGLPKITVASRELKFFCSGSISLNCISPYLLLSFSSNTNNLNLQNCFNGLFSC